MMTIVKQLIIPHLPRILTSSLQAAAREQGLVDLRSQLEKIVPDISEQYSEFKIHDEYMLTKIRNMHAFQISFILDVLHELENPTIVDIGDSAGTHLQYLLGMKAEGKSLKCLSVNLDPKAVNKIKSKGLEAIHARAEDLNKYDINPDIFCSFEMLEHLMDPINFLHQLSTKTQAKYLIITVPYRAQSRVSLIPIRTNSEKPFGAEETHIFELSPEDWKLIFSFSGWKVEREDIYYQFPKCHWARVTEKFWRKHDYEGFYGVRLSRDLTWAKRYTDWP